ncbi:type IX secretion system membrane protein PorP/SprF [Reichenbachiella agarivorans]|uniref:Type IX secretion system membrane protein PorP/SprF n=1 Tax=Reichenbachiella agarivorans TaxID=2979464 RepID=A0ABY6CMY1_9BACT|nr:type IX secretion system membrane protein PorP/SprF [Reichenbachiella agarivorans]UXP31861.1 type IX secretion system membrane protein PorP/SprF [Reichenbachiella agarivorans]
MKRYRVLLLIVVTCMSLTVAAQQRPVFSTYPYNGLSINPAYAGSLNLFSATFTNRNQWVNIDGAPIYQSLTAHTTFKENQIGTGINLVRDQVGVHEQYSVYGSFAYKIRMSKGILSMGLQGGFDQRTSNFQELDWFDPSDPLSVYSKEFNPNFGVGLYYANRDFFIGGSIPYILTPQIKYNAEVPTTGKSSRYYYVNGGFVKDLNRNLKINPSVLLRFQDNVPFAFDVNVNLIINEIVYAGVSYRHQDSFSLMTQLVLNENFRIGYAYDIPTSDLNGYTAGSHEILLNYRIRLKTSKKDGLCPVYF